VPSVSRPGSISPLTVESRPTSPATTVVRALSRPTRLPLVVAADVHRPMGGGRSLILSKGRLLVLLGSSRPVLTRLHGRHSDRPCVDSFPVTLMGQMIGYVR